VPGPDRTDVVIATTGAAAALAGLVLVFLGALVTTYQQLLGNVDDDALREIKTAGLATLGVFLFSLVCVVVDIAWLASGGGSGLYRAIVVLFFAQLATLALLASWTTVRVLLD